MFYFIIKKKLLIAYFEFLQVSRMIGLPLNIYEKLYWQHLFEKLDQARTFIFANTIQYLHILKVNIYHWKKRGPTLFSHSDNNPALGHVLVQSFNKTYVLVVGVKLVWLLFLNTVCLNFDSRPNKSRRFSRFRRSYVNYTVVVPTNHCQSYNDFLLNVRCSKWPHSFFVAISPQWYYICITYFCWAHLLLERLF